MANDTVSKEVIYPCEAASYEKLDAMLQTTYGSLQEDTDDLSRFIHEEASRNIRWDKVRHLRIIGDDDYELLQRFANAGISRGFYLNADGSWLLLILPEKPYLGDYLSRCGAYLESLALMNTQMYSRDLQKVPGLRELYLEDNLLIDTIAHIDCLTRLERLSINTCPRITTLQGLGKLTALTELHIFGCHNLTALPELSDLTQLKKLGVFSCAGLTALPGLNKLTQLTQLKISDCDNLILLPNLEDLTHLTHLHISDFDSLTSLPWLRKMTQLTQLHIAYCNSLTSLPGLGELRKLTHLHISDCDSLDELSDLENLTQLTHLHISDCFDIATLPDLGNLTHLTHLFISDFNELTAVPWLKKLTQLTELHIGHCVNLTSLSGLEELKQLKELRIRNCTAVDALPGLQNLSRLEILELSFCPQFRTLPEDIRHLGQLRYLDLTGLHLQDLPDWLPQIAEAFTRSFEIEPGKTRAAVRLWGTIVDEIRDMSFFDRPYNVIVDWFENRKRSRMQTLNEIKVVFLGDGEAGKSHTIARLMNDGGEPDHLIFDGQSTPGIVIRNKEYTYGDRTFQVHYWDFGGQEIMHSMHRIFLTGRTMYVILLNARDDTQSDRAKYWLHNVKSFAPDAPVLLVLNKIDQNENASVDETDLRSRYGKLTQIVRLSARDYTESQFNDNFTRVLLEEILKTGFLDAEWPVSWTQVKKEVEDMDSHFITGDTYLDICKRHDVARNRKELLHWFNDLGISFCCCDEEDYALEDYVILRPDWITNALYIILFNRLEKNSNGLIPHQSIYQLLRNAHEDPAIRCTLPNARYTNSDIQYVLGIMRKFNLSFTDGLNNEFIPMLCQQNSTLDVQYYRKDTDTLEFNMEFDYLPNNLLHRLMVERHAELDMDNVWRTGARFHLDTAGLSAVVVIDGNTLSFFIRHKNNMHRPNTYLTMLKDNVDRIVKKMNLQEPSCQLIYKLDGKQDIFDYDTLKLMQDASETHTFSKTWKRRIPIADILNQSAPVDLENETRLLNGIRSSCLSIQAEPVYRLIKNVNGRGYVNGPGMEDMRNRRIRDDLNKMNFRVEDQTQRGSSGTGVSIGELDMLVYNKQGEPWTIIEALRVNDGGKTEWNEHLKKLICNYNYFGARFLFLLTYVDAEPGKFTNIWDGYQKHIIDHRADGYEYIDDTFYDLNDDDSPQYIKAARCRYRRGGASVTVYHIFARIPTQHE